MTRQTTWCPKIMELTWMKALQNNFKRLMKRCQKEPTNFISRFVLPSFCHYPFIINLLSDPIAILHCVLSWFLPQGGNSNIVTATHCRRWSGNCVRSIPSSLFFSYSVFLIAKPPPQAILSPCDRVYMHMSVCMFVFIYSVFIVQSIPCM